MKGMYSNSTVQLDVPICIHIRYDYFYQMINCDHMLQWWEMVQKLIHCRQIFSNFRFDIGECVSAVQVSFDLKRNVEIT